LREGPPPRSDWRCTIGWHSMKLGRLEDPKRDTIAIEWMWCRRCGHVPPLPVDRDAQPQSPWKRA